MRLAILFLALIPAIAVHADEWWTWTLLDVYHEAPWSAGVMLVNRLDLDDGPFVQMISPRVKYELTPWLDAGLALSALSIENTSGMRYSQFRPELELNPKFSLSDDLRLEWRNRMEWRYNEGESFTVHRSRHRLQLTWTLPNAFGPLKRVFVSNECLIDLHRGDWSENRLVPVGLTFTTSARTDLDLFYMLLSHHQHDDWQTESVIGTYLRVRF